MTIRSAMIAIALASGAVPAAAQLAPVAVPTGLAAPGGSASYYTHRMRSWKSMKFDDVVAQHTDFSCGAAALATIFNYAYGKHTTEGQVLVNMLKIADPQVVRDKGFSLLDMKHYVSAVGMTGAGFKVDYPALKDLKVPGIVLLNIRGYKHFVVVRKVSADDVQLADPALGNRVMSRPAFEKAWNGIVFVVLGDGYDPNSPLKNPPPPLSAKRLFDQRSPIPDAELPGYGIETANSVRF